MLIHMSSYPRSGNSLMQQLVNNYFEKPWTSVDAARRPLERITGTPDSFTNWRYKKEMLEVNQSSLRKLARKLNNRFFKRYNLEDWLAYYDLTIPPNTKNNRYLLPGCLNALTLENREKLADADEYFFVKTHWLPYESYLPHEYSVQIVRHPKNVFVSYLNFIRDFENVTTKSLEEVIEGDISYGSWSRWHQAWDNAAAQLGPRFLRLKFEDTIADKIKACDQIEACLSLAYNHEKQDISFEQMRKVNPKYYRSGKAKATKDEYTEQQLSLIKRLHEHTMNQLGYSVAV